MAIEDENGTLALKKIEELAALQNSKDIDRLKGITYVKDAQLSALNDQLLTELNNINISKLADEEKDRLREIAFGKYNSALLQIGDVLEKQAYSERTQIQLTEIARMAALYDGVNASITLERLRVTTNLDGIKEVRNAQALADKERLDALLEYINLLRTLGGAGVGLAGASSDSIASLLNAKEAELSAITAEQSAFDAIIKADTLLANLARVYGSNTNASALLGGYVPFVGSNVPNVPNAFSPSGAGYGNNGTGNQIPNYATYNVTVNAGAVGNETLVKQAVQEAILSINRDGNSTQVAGAIGQ